MRKILFIAAFMLFAGMLFAQPCGLSLIVLSTSSGSCGQCDGSITVSASNGTPPFVYSWSNNQTDSIATNLCGGTYTCTVTDADSCFSSGTITLTQSPAVTFSVSVTEPSCPTCCDGSATGNVLTGNPPFLYDWSDGATAQTDTGLCEGKYILCVTDANGCLSCDTIDLAADSAWGIEAYDPAAAFSIYPNPASDFISIELKNKISGNAQLQIRAITGSVVYSQLLNVSQASSFEVNVSALAPGFYLISVETANGAFYRRFYRN